VAWQGSDRRSRLPSDWKATRRTVLARDGYRCCAVLVDGTRCAEAGTDVDHIIAGDDHSLTNLQLLCRWHHARKSTAEGHAARAARPRPGRQRPERPHPGRISG